MILWNDVFSLGTINCRRSGWEFQKTVAPQGFFLNAIADGQPPSQLLETCKEPGHWTPPLGSLPGDIGKQVRLLPRSPI